MLQSYSVCNVADNSGAKQIRVIQPLGSISRRGAGIGKIVVASVIEAATGGQVKKKEIPIKEDAPFRPASPYAVSKVAEDMLGWQYFLSWRIKTIRTRMFTHTGPRRGEVFAESNFAKQIAEIEAGL